MKSSKNKRTVHNVLNKLRRKYFFPKFEGYNSKHYSKEE